MKVLFPSKILEPYVEAYYISSSVKEDRFRTHFPASSTGFIKLSPDSAVVSGQATKAAANIESIGGMGVGIKLRYGAFYALFGIPAVALTDRVIRLDEILGSRAEELMERTAEEGPHLAQVYSVEQTLVRFAQSNRTSGDTIEQQAIAMVKQLPAMPVSKLAEKLGYSARQFQRRLNNYVGFSPSMLKRIVRFEKALAFVQEVAESSTVDWSATALTCGYSDQAHFIREFREFSGCTPALYFASLQPNEKLI